MVDGIPIGAIFNGVGVVGVVLVVGWMLATGRLATGRELREKNARIKALEEVLETRDGQLDLAVQTLPMIAAAMQGVHKAAEEATAEDTRSARANPPK